MKTKKFLALILSVLMLTGAVLPITAVAAEEAAAESETTYSIHDVLQVGAEGEYSTVYYGGIPWRVLSKEYSSDSEDENAKVGILLLSEHAMANGIQYNGHYSNGNWLSTNKAWASAMWMPWDDERNPNYEKYLETGIKVDDSSGGYLTSDIRMYLTGQGTYETVRPYAYYNESWPANWWGTPDRNSKANKYYIRNVVEDTTPIEGVTYFVKNEFELSDHNRNNNEGWLPITAADWQENTWYTLDENGVPVLMTSFPTDVTTVNAYYDQSGYSIADVSEGFEDGVTYYTFERKTTAGDTLPTVTTNGTDYVMGEHLASLYMFVAYSIPDLANSNSNNALTEGTFVSGLDASANNFALDMGFSAAEIAAVLLTSGHGYTNGTGVYVSVGTTYGDRLDGDSYFSLSGEEVKIYLTDAGHTKPATYFDGTAVGDIWTRSWGKADTQCVIVYTNNACSWRQGANNTWQSIRPAFNLNPDSVVMYTAIAENTYKMTLIDETRNFTIVSSNRKGDILTIGYTGAVIGENEYLSYVLKDKTTGEMVKYGTLAEVTSESGTVDIDVSGIDSLNYDMYVFSEQINGEIESNYASAMQKVEYPLSDFAFTLTTDKTALKATESLNATVSIDGSYYSLEYTFTYDVSKFACEADVDNDGVIYVTNLYKGSAGELATYTLVAKNDIESVSVGNVLTVTGNVVQYKEQLISDLENAVTGDEEIIKISLNYTAEIKADFVQGYSLVLVKGDDSGYAYNGVKMFYVEYYDAYAVLVEGEVTYEMIDLALSKAVGCETITQSYDVNAEYVSDGIVDLKDATAIYACTVIDFNVNDYMELFLRSDVNGDYVVNMIDINAVTARYTK